MADLTVSAAVDTLMTSTDAEDARDNLILTECGSYYFSTPASTTLGAATPALASGTTTEIGTGVNTTISATNRVTYDGAASDRLFLATISISMTKGAGGSTVGSVILYKNGSAVTGARIDRDIANANDEGAVSLSTVVSLTGTDYLEIWVESDTGDDITIESGGLTIIGI